MSDKTCMTMTRAVEIVINGFEKNREFNGYELKDCVTRLCPRARNMYVDTILRVMRKKCHYQYELVSRAKSLYKKI